MAENTATRGEGVVISLVPGESRAGLGARTDDELMLLAAGGSAEAFGVLIGRHESRLLTFCTRMVGDKDVGREVAQEILLELWRNADRYKPMGLFKAYLFTLAANRAKNAHRRRRPEPRSPDSVAAEAAVDPDQLTLLLQQERQRRLNEAISHLPERQRAAVLLRLQEGLPYEAIGEATGAPVRTVRSWIFHAIRRLRIELEGL